MLQTKSKELLERNYDKFFIPRESRSSKDSDDNIDIEGEEDEEERIVVKDDETMSLKSSVVLPTGFIPRDFDYYEIDDDLVIIGICGGNEVIFAWLSKQKNSLTMG